MVIIISSKSDTHALAVLEELRQIDAPVRLLDLSDFPLRSKLSMTYTARNGPRFTLDTDTGLIDFSEVNSIWWRRPQQFQLDPCIQNQSHAQFAFNESQEAIMGLWQSLDIFWINDPARDAAAHRKAYQLKLARELGIPTPETLITNDPNAARQFIKMNEKTICKAFSATQDNWRETRLVGEQELVNIDSVRFAPVIFQSYIEAIYDLRITVVGDDIFPAAIHSQETAYAVDCRIDIGKARIESVKIPELVQQQLRQLMKMLGLVYGAIDMRLEPDGRYVFLEVNPAGQFHFIETITKQPIAKSLASHLVASSVSSSMVKASTHSEHCTH